MTLSDVELHLVESVDEALALKRWLGERREVEAISVDIETTGLSVERDRVRMIQFGDLRHGWAIPRDDWLGVAREVVRDYRGRFIGHNVVQFDAPILSRDCGIDLPPERTDCTRMMSHVLEPHLSTALKSQASRHVDTVAAGAQRTLDEAIGAGGGWTWETIPVTHPAYWTYAALDTVLTAHLERHHRPLIDLDAPRAYELELAVSWPLARMRRYGARVDVDYSRQRMASFDRFVEEAAHWVKTTYGVSPGSNQSVIGILEREGLTFDKLTTNGAKSLDAEVLRGVDHPLARTILQRRRLQKLSSTYLRHFIKDVDADALLHPSINVVGARTSRMSMAEPNLQNLPRRSESNPAADAIRDAIVSRYVIEALGSAALRDPVTYDPLEHGALLMCDFDQIEMRLLAHMADDSGLIDAFHSDGDFFVNLARRIFSDPTLEKRDPRRQLTKNTGYAKIYGAGVAKMALTAGVPEPVMASVNAEFDKLFPGARNFQRRIDALAWERAAAEGVAYVRSPLTRRRHVADRGKVYALVNYLIQGTAAEVLKMKILDADAAGLGDWLVVPVHDELVMDVPAEHVREAANTLLRVMTDATGFRVPITASVSYGASWGTKREWSHE